MQTRWEDLRATTAMAERGPMEGCVFPQLKMVAERRTEDLTVFDRSLVTRQDEMGGVLAEGKTEQAIPGFICVVRASDV